jgi:MarR-like DNA-binding transcriptional regulator SgrR of sgrS sRNA
MLLDLGKNNLVEVAPELIRQAQSGNRDILTSQPEELLCLVFARDPQSDAETQLRTALQRSIDTNTLNNVIFQAGGEPAGGLLPGWLSGYEFLFPSGASSNLQRARMASPRAALTLAYDSSDTIAHVVADRIALNARDAGITLQLVTSENADVRLMRVPLSSLNLELALNELARQLQLPQPKFTDNSNAAIYSAESALLQTHRILPLLHLRNAIAVRGNVHQVTVGADGSWELGNAWLSTEMP